MRVLCHVQSLPNSFQTPLAEVVVDSLPWWEVSGQQSPRTTASQDVEDRVEDLTQAVNPRTTSLVGAGRWASRQSHSASDRLVEYLLVVIATRVSHRHNRFAFSDSFYETVWKIVG